MEFKNSKLIAVKDVDEEWLQGLFDTWYKELANGNTRHIECDKCPNHLIRDNGRYGENNMIHCECTCSGTCHAFFRKFFKMQGFDTNAIWPNEITDKELCQGKGPAETSIKVFISDAYQTLLTQSKPIEMTESELDALLS